MRKKNLILTQLGRFLESLNRINNYKRGETMIDLKKLEYGLL